MADELSTNFERIRYEVLTIVHALVEIQSEDPPVKSVQEEPTAIIATAKVNAQLIKLIQDLQQ